MGINGCPIWLEKQRRIDELEEKVKRLEAKLQYQECRTKQGYFGSPNQLAKESVHRVYKSLYAVETDLRTMKTDLEVRPIYVRKKSRTRGHVLVVMLALILRRELEKMLKPLEMEVSQTLAVMDGWTLLKESLGELEFKRLPQPGSQQQKILDAVGLKQPTVLSVPRNKGRREKE